MTQGFRIDLAGRRFGRLHVIAYSHTRDKRAYWECLCDCGNNAVISGKNMRSGLTASCGCLRKEKIALVRATHRMSGTPTWISWAGMLTRCYNPKQEAYAKYGAIGIRVCDRWRESFENFFADMGERPKGMTLDRKNPFGNYEPGNCRWATSKDQSLNRRGNIAVAILEHMKQVGLGEAVDAAFKAIERKIP